MAVQKIHSILAFLLFVLFFQISTFVYAFVFLGLTILWLAEKAWLKFSALIKNNN